ncbi:MAG: phosphotransferase, partial [Verrucomicrobia bacterium]|nr:phosphotransferase [Verrucomicrobiota bacterium]
GIFGTKGIAQEVAILQEANRASISPKLLYASSETGLIIMEKIENILPAEFSPGLITASDDLVEQLLQHVRRLQSLTIDQACVTDRNDRFHLQKGVKVADMASLPKATQTMLEECLAWPVETEKVLNHNDLHTRNLLYDGKKLFIIDWECAGWGPRDADVAAICNGQVMTREAGLAFYARYLQRSPTAEEAMRFTRLRVMNAATNGMHGYVHYKPGAKNPLAHLQRPSCIETVRNMILYLDRGKIDIKDDDALQACGLAWLQYAVYLNS